ncbi:aminoacyl-tRNA deacylase [Kistimonas scapharcae]|uniref:Aminoacyl-tRNA deacylase n=1 Tax=Kistimonas scapharcae TaxID=1036133 RepID=A0ABP8V4N4_9GAMM
MSVSKKLSQFLAQQQVDFELIHHNPSMSAMQSSIAARVPSEEVAKAVILKDHVDNFLMAVIPAGRRLHLHTVEELTDQKLRLASEHELQQRFTDCKTGAIPAIGPAFDMSMVWDDRFLQQQDVYLEAGDHETLVHLSGKTFQKLASTEQHDQISMPIKEQQPE